MSRAGSRNADGLRVSAGLDDRRARASASCSAPTVARKKKQHEEESDRPAPPPNVGTSMKGLLKGVSLASLDQAAKAEAAEKAAQAARAAAEHAKSAKANAKPSQAHGKPSQAHAKPSQAHAKPSQGLPQKQPPPKPTPAEPTPAGPSGTTVVARPSESLKGHDRTAFYDAIAGVRSLDAGRPKPRRAVPVKTSAANVPSRAEVDAPARKQLGELVAGAHQFDVAIEDDGFVEGLRRDAPVEALGALRRAEPRVDQTLDLHGLREAIVEERLARWIREAHKKGARRLLVIHGKGLHSADGVAVLRDAVLRVLEASIATPLVLAFSSAPPAMGGTGATLVELSRARS